MLGQGARGSDGEQVPHQLGIVLRGVTKRFGAQTVVREVDLAIEPGEFFTMLGPSGSGKTTLLRLIAGFERLDAGTISLGGVDVTHLPPYQRDVNTVFQDYALFPHYTVAENVNYGLRVRKVARAHARERVAAALDMVKMGDFLSRKPGQLSGGQRQRVALARAIVNEPTVLLLDEPLGALDLKLRQEMQVELKRIQRSIGITFIYVTHDQEEALTMSDRLAVFHDGRIEQVGHPTEVYENPATEFVAGFVGTSNVIDTPTGHGVLRPEKIDIVPGVFAASATNAAGVVRDVAYLGMVTRYRVEVDAGRVMTAVRQNRSTGSGDDTLTVGSQVTLTWSFDDVSALPGRRDVSV
jgi:putative spermidine/putrescine transport system ATP-binding protein